MTLEKQLKQKNYYKMFINEHENIHPVRALGDTFLEEAKKDVPNLTYIRFAQGEVYFHHKDYETAIFKWENIINELEPWAKKNTADAYYELGMLSTAEDIYCAVQTSNSTLQAEVALKLFSLYRERGKHEAAVLTIKKAVDAHPDYPTITEIARNFFEENEDWENAVRLAVNEAIRTGSHDWFRVVHTYVEEGMIRSFSPEYFTQALTHLFYLCNSQFEELVVSLWNHYKSEGTYFSWLKEMNYLLLNLDIKREDRWTLLPGVFKEQYLDLVSGQYLISQFQDLVPDTLTNWLRLADQNTVVLASAATLTWNELFPTSISESLRTEAENLLVSTSATFNDFEECLSLFEAIISWAQEHEMGECGQINWIVQQIMNFDSQYVFVTGLSGSGKSSFIDTVLGEDLQDSPTSSMVMFTNGEELDIKEVTESEIKNLDGFNEFQERMDRRRNALDSIIHFQYPNSFLQETGVTLIDTPGLKGDHVDRFGVLRHIHMADSILFVLDANAPFTEKDQRILSSIQQLESDIPIHFLISKMDTIADEQEAIHTFEDTRSRIHSHFPNAKVFSFYPEYERGQELKDLKAFMESLKIKKNLEDYRLGKLLHFIRSTIASLIQKRADVENRIFETIKWNEEIVMKLTGTANQLKDTESQKIRTILKSYQSVKTQIEKEISEAVPKMLQECSTLIKEDSNFSKIHLELNDEMNRRLQEYLSEQVMPKYYTLLQQWIKDCREEFDQNQEFLSELRDGFNQIYGEERLNLECDFKVLEDWSRDTDRMTNRFQLEKVNILLRRTPSQILLKSAGKLFGAISQNKAILYNKYKAFVENETYTETHAEIFHQFFRPFEIFEKSLERDVKMFFNKPMNELELYIEEASLEIQKNKEELDEMNTNPEQFRDPLTLFEIRLRQFEWMTVAGKGLQNIY